MIIAAEWLIDGTGAAPLRNTRIVVRNGLVEKVKHGDAIDASAADFSFPGCTILPGLIDTHVHLTFGALDSHEAVVRQVSTEPEPMLVARAIGNAQAALRAGITTLRDCGGRGLRASGWAVQRAVSSTLRKWAAFALQAYPIGSFEEMNG